MDKRHTLIRTSPKGGPFIGDCLNCGMVDLNPMDTGCEGLASQDDLLVAIITMEDEAY